MKRSGGRSSRWLAKFVLRRAVTRRAVTRRPGWLAAVVSACCVAALAGAPALALGGSSSVSSASPVPAGSPAGAGSGASSSLDGALVIQGSPVEGEQMQAQERAKLANPEAVAAREASRTKFEHLGTAQALRVAREAFPGVVDETAGGAPKLPAGERIVKYEARNAAAIALPDGKHGVVESLGPIATSSGHGHFTPINLALRSAGNGYAPANSDVAVQIPKHASSGVSMPGDGVSLTPVNAQGQPLSGSEGVQEGASVLYANTQTDTDTLAKPTTGGFEIDSLLRSVDSPETLYYKVGMPAGARLVSDKGPGGVRVVLGGKAIATIAPVSAQDAAGTGIPVDMNVSGDTLVVAVKRGSGEYQYPIEVDPQAYDETIHLPSNCINYNGEKTDWEFSYSGGGFKCYSSGVSEGYGVVMATVGGINEGEHDELRYTAHGQSSVGFIEEESSASASEQSGAITKLEFTYKKTAEEKTTVEHEFTLAGSGHSYSKVKEGFGDLWNESEEHYQGYNNENLVRIMQTATHSAAEGYGFWFELNNGAYVGINQKTGPSVSFNTSESTINEAAGRQNVLYGSGGWLGEYNGAVAITATDPGLGVSYVKIEDLTPGPHGEHWTFVDPVYSEHLCTGVWCTPTYKTYFTYNKEMAEGSNTFLLCAEDEAYMSACKEATVKVDDAPPYGIKIASGLKETGAELNATQHQVTVEASDEMSGVKSIAVSIDGKEIKASSGGSCTGKCTASETFTIDGESLGAGEHKLLVAPVDYAENQAPRKEYTFAIRNATPVKLGPGTVDPVTGQFALSASDVDVAGVGGVSRSYDSRSTGAALESPLGPQWSLSSGAGQKLNLLPDGSAELVGSGGEPTIFEKTGTGFQAPQGDGNLTLEPKEKEAGKGITEYLLKDPAAGTTTVFTRPLEQQYVVPRYFASTSANTPDYQWVSHIGIDSKGDIWGSATGSIDEFNSNREFVMTFGYGVKDGKNELETCTANCRTGLQDGGEGNPSFIEALAVDSKGNVYAVNGAIEEYNEHGGFVEQFAEETRNDDYGAGSGEIWNAKGIAIGANGNVWVADTGNNRVDEFNEKHEFVAAFGFGVLDGGNKFEVCTTVCERGIRGSEPGQFYEPEGIAVHNGFVWVADTMNDRVEKFTEKYEYLGAFGSNGTGNGQFVYPRHMAADNKGDLWVVDGENGRVEEFSEAGAYLGQFGETGTEAERLHWYDFWLGGGGVAVDSSGNVWVGAGLLKEWAHSTWVATRTENTAPGDTRATSYRSVMAEGQTITEPIEELGPVPAGVTCGKNPAEVSQAELSARLAELKAGCRALSFTYAEKTGTLGENEKEWGEYNGRLMKISLTAYNPATKAMETKPVAEYAYDKQGRLRAEWNPQITSTTDCGKTCSSLKTTYGYDSEGHVTALTPPGQQPWAFTYGAISGDASTGRLLKVTRAQPKAGAPEAEVKSKLKEQAEQPTKTEAPKLSGTAVVGVKMGVSAGVWGKSPVAYAYQWEDCNSEEKECTPILGATNANYTVASSDVGHKLLAVVTATNGGGSVSATPTTASSVVSSSGTKTEGTSYGPQPGSTVEYHVPLSGSGAPHEMTSTEMAKWGQVKDLPEEATAIFPPDEPQGWPAAAYKRASIGYMDAQAREVDAASPSGGISTTEYNSLNEVTRTLSADNRATALKEGSKSAEVAEHLSTIKVYNGETQAEKEQEEKEISERKKPAVEPGARLLETVGPEHEVRLANGAEEETRDRQTFSYNEGAPAGETHNLLTNTIAWAETTGKKILGKHETHTAYNGQNELGWKLRKPTRTTSTVEGHTNTETMTYERETGNPLETSSSLSINAPVFAWQVGSSGSGNGQFSGPAGAALDAGGDVWVADRANNRIEELSQTGQFIAAYGTEGAGAGQFKGPTGIAVNQSTGNVYVADSANNRIEELSSAGKFVATFGFGVSNGKAEFETCTSSCQAGVSGSGNGQFNDPVGIAVDASGNVWVVDHGNNRLEKFSSANGFLAAYGSTGSGEAQFKEPAYLALSGGNVFVTDYGNHRVEELSSAGKFVATFGFGVSNGKAEFETCTSSCQAGISGSGKGQFANPDGIAANPSSGALYVGDPGNSRVEQFSEAGVYVTQFGASGSGNGQFKEPVGIAADATGQIYLVDSGNARVQMWEPVPANPIYTAQFGNTGSESEKLKDPTAAAVDAHGDVWVTQGGPLEEFSSSGAFIKGYGTEGTGLGQFDEPTGIAINQSKGIVYVSDLKNNRVEELNEKGEFIAVIGFGVSNGKEEFEVCTSSCEAGIAGAGSGQFSGPEGIAIDPSGNVWVADYKNNRLEEFNEKNEFVEALGFGVSNGESKLQTCTTKCEAGLAGSSPGEFNGPEDPIFSGGDLYVTDLNNDRVEEFNSAKAYVTEFGSKGSGNGQLSYPDGIAADSHGNLYVADIANNRVEEFTASGTFVTTFGSAGSGNGQFSEPEDVTINSAGDLYVTDTGNHRVQEWTPSPAPGNEGANSSKTIYYTAAANAEYPNCGGHPEWANLVCQTEPVVQPGDSGPPPLPVTTTTYNMWDAPETVTEKIGSVTRTTKRKYDGAGRETESEETSTASEDKALPAVTDEYSSETGALVKLTSTIESKARTITSVYNTLGQLASYTDAEGSTTKYTYDIDGRVEEMSEPKGSQIYAYSTTTGFLEKLQDNGPEGKKGAGLFTATYDVEGKMLTEGYPNGMTAKYTYNSIGQATNLVYEKTNDCAKTCPEVWFSDADAFGPKGELASQASTLSSESYSYNEGGQLTQTQETPVGGKGCITRLYGYNEASGERESSATYEPNAKGECTTEGGMVEGHFYDVVGRLLDPGVTYDALGNMTKVPALDAGGSAITSSFYVDNQVAVQEQNEKSISYTYDPAGRTMLAKTKTGSSTSTAISHYAGPGNALTWTCEESGECKEEKETKWTRNIPGIDGALDAIQTSGETPVLQLHDLQGDIVATAADSETETKPLTTHNSVEFGVPVGTTPKYSWLGATGAESELGTGVITQEGATYVPQVARTLQTEEITPPGAAPNGVMDTEAYTPPELGWANQSGNEAAANTVSEQRALERQACETSEVTNAVCSTVDPPRLLLYSGPNADKLLGEIERGKLYGETALFIIGNLFGVDFTAGEIAASEFLRTFSEGLEFCVGEIGPASAHGGCLVELHMHKIEWKDVIGALAFGAKSEVFLGGYSIFACYRTPDTKKGLTCPSGEQGKEGWVLPNA